MDKRQLTLLGIAMLLGTAAIGLTAARRALKAQEQARAEQAEAEAVDDVRPLDRSAVSSKGERIRKEDLGRFQVRIKENNHAGLFGPGGELLYELDGYQGTREVPGARLFDGPVVEFAGKLCDDPCNPIVAVVALRDGKPRRLMIAKGVPKVQDLDRDGVPDAVVEHLMEGSADLVTLPYRLEGEHFVPAYERFPDGVDRQVDEHWKATERLCAKKVDDECRGAMRLLVGAAAFRGAGKLPDLLGRLDVCVDARNWLRGNSDRIAKEIAGVVKP